MQTKYTFFCKIIITLLFVSLFFSISLTYNDILIKKRSNAIYINSSKKSDVISSLTKGGVELNDIDKMILDFIALPQKGWYKIENNPKGRFYFFSELLYQKADTMGIVIFAGDTIAETLERLAKDMGLDEEVLLSYYTKYSKFLEGEILAKKYFVAKEADEEVIVRYLLDVSNIELDFFAREKFGSSYTHEELHKALITASIIHKESNNLKEMSTIASVINNRINKGMRLQMDGTLCYGKYSHKIVTSKRIKEDKSHFNTYKYKGLPPHPICAITMESLEAVALPKDTDYLYFMLNRDGTHTFAKDYDEHRNNIKKFRKKREVKEKTKKKPCKDNIKKVETIEKKKIEDKKVKVKEKVKPKEKEIIKIDDRNISKEPTKSIEDINSSQIVRDLNDSILSVF
jgi:UPF0755 protein